MKQFNWDAIPDMLAAREAGAPLVHMRDARLPMLCGGKYVDFRITPCTLHPENVTCPECLAAFAYAGIEIPPIMLPVRRKVFPKLPAGDPVIRILDSVYDALSTASETYREDIENAIGPDMTALMSAIMTRIEQAMPAREETPVCDECGGRHH